MELGPYRTHRLAAVAFDDSTGATVLIESISSVDRSIGLPAMVDTERVCFIRAVMLSVGGGDSKLLWTSTQLTACLGIGVTSDYSQGVVIAGSYADNELRALRLSNGSVAAALPLRNPMYVTAAPPQTSGAFFVNCSPIDGSDEFLVLPCSYSAPLRRIVKGQPLALVPDARLPSPIIVLPPLRGRRRSHLVIASMGTGNLRIFSLPDYRLVHSHTLEGMKITGLATDVLMAGCDSSVLVVCDAACQHSGRVRVLEWPLSGMPDLE
jgi:hypothetical protein